MTEGLNQVLEFVGRVTLIGIDHGCSQIECLDGDRRTQILWVHVRKLCRGRDQRLCEILNKAVDNSVEYRSRHS